MSHIKRSIVIAGLATAFAASAFAADPPPRPTPHPPAALANTSLLWCGDAETPRAAPELYGDDPIYVGNTMPIEKMRRWARSKPGFVDVTIDRDNNGWINARFTEDVEQRQAELEREFPGVGVVAVEVANSRRDLRRLARRVGDFIELRDIRAGYGWGNAENIVQLTVPVVTDELARALDEAFAGEALCIDGADPEDLPQPGPQPVRGDGWVMLAWEQGRGPAHRVGIATDQASYQRLWHDTQLAGSPPEVEFESDVVVWFAEGHGSGCPNLRMDEVIVDHEHRQVYPLIAHLDETVACTLDLAGAYQFVAALERRELPRGPFEIGLGGGDGQLWRRLLVDADLSMSGSVARPDDIGKPPPRIPRSGTYQEPFGRFRYALDAGCGIGYLGVINGVHWVTPKNKVPLAWVDAVRPNGEIVVTVSLHIKRESHAKVSRGGHTVRYEPAADAPPTCER